MKLKQWINEIKASWRDKNFICAVVGFITAYASIIILGLLLPAKIFIAILASIAGWQLATWSWYFAPKIKKLVLKA